MPKTKSRAAIAILGMLACGNASVAPPSLTNLRCTFAGKWACADGQTCEAGKAAAAEHYVFDLAALTYRGLWDRGPITDLETDDGGFMSFALGKGGWTCTRTPTTVIR